MKRIILFYFFIVCTLPSFSQVKNDSVLSNPPDTVYQNTRDSIGISTKVGIEASYPGGAKGWRDFIVRTLNGDSAFQDLPNNQKNYRETVLVSFIVCADGTVCEVKVLNNVLHSLKREAERILKSSGNWIPATLDGKKVKAYRKQPITFIFESR